MAITLWTMLLLMLASAATLFIDGPIIDGVISAVASVSLILGVLGLRPLEGAHIAKALQWLLALAAAPALWMIVQILPLPATFLAHPIWSSAQEALGTSLIGHLTIDIGDSVQALGRYCSVLAIIFLSAIAAIDRGRAEWILSSLAIVSVLAASVALIEPVLGLATIADMDLSGSQAPAQALASVGVPLTATVIDRSVERYETRSSSGRMLRHTFLFSLLTSSAGFLICVVATLFAAPPALRFAALAGLFVLCLVILIRRLGLGKWIGALLFFSAVCAGGIIAAGHGNSSTQLTLRFTSPASDAAVIERMIADNAAGSGAGTFAALLPIYSNNEETTPQPPASAAAKIAVELGRPAPLIGTLLAIVLIGLLVRGGFERGRDSFYAAGAAACVVTILLESFIDASLFSTPVSVIAASIIGLGLSQRISRALT